MAHVLPSLPYAHDALEPHIDTQTMQIHHDKHHAAYVTNANAALESAPDLASSSELILRPSRPRFRGRFDRRRRLVWLHSQPVA